jgi:hypothetical protein
MFGRKLRVSPLESRKRLLIAESEINRARLLQEGQMLVDGLSSLADRARSFSIIAASILSLGAGLATFTRRRRAPAARSSLIQKVASGARLATTIWLLFRSRGSDCEPK